MKLGFVSHAKDGSDVRAIFDHALSLTEGSADGVVEFRHEPGPASHCDVIVSDIEEAQSKSNFLLNTEGSQIKCGTPRKQDTAFKAYLVSNEYRRAKLVKQGVSQDKVHVIGMPRLDLLFGTAQEKEALKRIYLRSVGADPLAKTVLFLVDWRNFGRSDADVCLLEQAVSGTADNYGNFLIYRQPQLEIPEPCQRLIDELKCLVVSPEEEVTPFLSADVLLTDFVSLSRSFLALERPIVSLYPEVRVLRDEEWFKPRIFKGSKDFRKALYKMQDLWRPKMDQVKSYFEFTDGLCCERAVDAIMKVHQCA